MGFGTQIKKLDPEKAGLHIIDDAELLEIQNTLLGMLHDLIRVFDAHQIGWSMSGGGILGAVRHQGFIPWDDDIDIFMTRANFEAFRKIFDETLGRDYRLRIPGDEGYILHYPTVEKRGTRVLQVQSTGEEQGLFIDIFLLENAPDNKILCRLHGIRSTIYLGVDSFVRTKRCRKNLLKYGKSSPELVKAVNLRCILSTLFGFRKMEKWMYLSDKCFSSEKNPKTKYVVCPSGACHYFGEIYLREQMEQTKTVDYSGIQVKIPQDPHYYLNIRYGSNYMQVPSEENRERHAYVEVKL